MKKVLMIHTLGAIYNTMPAQLKETLGGDVEVTNVLDEILLSNMEKKGCFTKEDDKRLLEDMKLAEDWDMDVVVVSCSSLTPHVLRLQDQVKKRVITIDKGMCHNAAVKGNKILVLCTSTTTVKPTVSMIENELKALGRTAELIPVLKSEAKPFLVAGNVAKHNEILAEEAAKYPDVDLIVLAQASMAPAEEAVAAKTGKPVLTSPKSCIGEVMEFYGL